MGVIAEIIVRIYYGSETRMTCKIRNTWRQS